MLLDVLTLWFSTAGWEEAIAHAILQVITAFSSNPVLTQRFQKQVLASSLFNIIVAISVAISIAVAIARLPSFLGARCKHRAILKSAIHARCVHQSASSSDHPNFSFVVIVPLRLRLTLIVQLEAALVLRLINVA